MMVFGGKARRVIAAWKGLKHGVGIGPRGGKDQDIN